MKENNKVGSEVSIKNPEEKDSPSIKSMEVRKWLQVALALVIGGGGAHAIIQKIKAPQEVVTNMDTEHPDQEHSDRDVKEIVRDEMANTSEFLELSQNSIGLKSADIQGESFDFSAFGKEYQATVQSMHENSSGGVNIVAEIENGTLEIYQVGKAVHARMSILEDGQHKTIELRNTKGGPVWQEYKFKENEEGSEELDVENPSQRTTPISSQSTALKSTQDGIEFPAQAECVAEEFVYHYFITQTLVDEIGLDATLALVEGSVDYYRTSLRNSDPRLKYAEVVFTYDVVDITDAEEIPINGGTGDTYTNFTWLLLGDDPHEIKDLAAASPTSNQCVLCLHLKDRLGAATRLARPEPSSGILYNTSGVQDEGLGSGHRTMGHESGHANANLLHNENSWEGPVVVTNSSTGQQVTINMGTIMGLTGASERLPMFSTPDTTYHYSFTNSAGTWTAEFTAGNTQKNSVDSIAKYFDPTGDNHDKFLHETDVLPAPPSYNIIVEHQEDSVKISIGNFDPALTYYWDNGMIGHEIMIPIPDDTLVLKVHGDNVACNCPGEEETLVITHVGIDDPEELGNNIQIYPNPSPNNGPVNINGLSNLMGKRVRCLLFDAQGRVVHAENFDNVNDKLSFEPKTSQGVYFLKVLADGKVIKEGKLIRL
jgi:hypothetical protein